MLRRAKEKRFSDEACRTPSGGLRLVDKVCIEKSINRVRATSTVPVNVGRFRRFSLLLAASHRFSPPTSTNVDSIRSLVRVRGIVCRSIRRVRDSCRAGRTDRVLYQHFPPFLVSRIRCLELPRRTKVVEPCLPKESTRPKHSKRKISPCCAVRSIVHAGVLTRSVESTKILRVTSRNGVKRAAACGVCSVCSVRLTACPLTQWHTLRCDSFVHASIASADRQRVSNKLAANMALVMLPCDLPWWPAVVKQLDRAAAARNSENLVEAMQRLHDMCNISLDPEEDSQDPEQFSELIAFLESDLDSAEREHVLAKTIPRMVERAKALRSCKPPQGLHFSLQQQGDCVEYSYGFVSSLIANAFFSTYPKRTTKTHPTLRDFNFTNFFKHLRNNGQKAKLRSIFHYYDYLEMENALDGKLVISRQVMSSKQWLTIEDWLESNVPLCPLMIRHEGRLERVEPETKVLRVCFASAKFGGGVLDGDVTQETVHIATHPEMLAAILSVEALEDNEALIVEGVRHLSRINDPRNRATFEALSKPNVVTVCCIDPEDYSTLPLAQFEEDNVLREMNKSLLGFRQRYVPSSPTDPIGKSEMDPDGALSSRRLSPIGESFSSTPPETDADDKPVSANRDSKQEKSERISTERSKCEDSVSTEVHGRPNGKSVRSSSPHKPSKEASCASRRNRFIVLGSSGEVLPVTRKSLGQMSVYSSCNSQSTDSFHSAKDTIEEDPEEEEQRLSKRYSSQLDTPERRGTFAQRLREALKRESTATGGAASSNTSSGESSYAVGISVSGSHVYDQDIKVKRGGSRGFVLRDETVDEEFLKESLEAEQKWLGRFRQNQSALQRRDTSASSRYSFSTEYNSDFCSELEEVYEQLAKWLEDPIAADESRELDARDRAVVRFAGSLLKRALSESFAGVPVQEGEPQPLIDSVDVNQRHKLALAVRSLSLELARQKNRRQQSVSEPEDVEYYEELSNRTMSKEVKDIQRKKLRAVTFTSEVFQTLVDDETTVYLSNPVSLSTSGPIKDKLAQEFESHVTLDIPRDSSPQSGGLLSVVTGNWGCGSRLKGDPQLKLVIQWLAASLAGVPKLIYYTAGNPRLSKLDTVSRVLMDRHWSVGDLAAAALKFSLQIIEDRMEGRNTLFEEIIGMDKPSP